MHVSVVMKAKQLRSLDECTGTYGVEKQNHNRDYEHIIIAKIISSRHLQTHCTLSFGCTIPSALCRAYSAYDAVSLYSRRRSERFFNDGGK